MACITALQIQRNLNIFGFGFLRHVDSKKNCPTAMRIDQKHEEISADWLMERMRWTKYWVFHSMVAVGLGSHLQLWERISEALRYLPMEYVQVGDARNVSRSLVIATE